MVPDPADHGQAPIPVSLLAFSIFITLSTAMLLVLMASRVDRRNAEALARQARVTNDTTERYQTLLRHSFDLIAPLDAEGRFIDEAISSDRLLGYEPGELMGKRFTDLVSDGERADAQAWLAAVLLSDKPLSREYSFLSRTGGEIPCECNAVRAKAQGTAWSLIVNVRDLTEKRQMEAMLGQSQRLEALGRMSSGMAHDFSNLITAVSLNLESIERRLPSSDLLEHLRASQTALSHGNSLIRQLLAFARQQKVEPEPIDLNAAVEGMDRFIQMSLSADIAVELDLADGLWPCTADRGMLEAALLNLVVNAQDAMPDGGRLTIATANREHQRPELRTSAGRLRRAVADRHRQGHVAGSGKPRRRTVLHDQGRRPGDRTRPQHGVRLRAAVRRRHADREHRGPGHHRPDPPASQPRPAGRKRVANRNAISATATPSCWSMTTMPSVMRRPSS